MVSSPAGKERILEVATRLFAERGFDAASMRSIADEARCNVALAYHHFGSKEALYEEIFREHAKQMQSIVLLVGEPAGSARERIGRLVDRTIDFMVGQPLFVKILIREVLAPSEIYIRHSQRHMRVLLRAAEAAIEDAVRRDRIKPVSAREFLILVYGMLTYYVAAHTSLQQLFGENPLGGEAVERLRAEAKALVFARLGLRA